MKEKVNVTGVPETMKIKKQILTETGPIYQIAKSAMDDSYVKDIDYPACFCNISEPYDKKNHVARYHFTQCPNAEFAKNIILCMYSRFSAIQIIGESARSMER